MNVVITKSQYQKIVFNLLDVLYGPNFTFKKNDVGNIEIYSNYGEEIFRVYTKDGRSEGCKRDMLVLPSTIEDIKDFVPIAVLRKKLFSKTIVSYINKKTKLNIDCIDFAYNLEYDYNEDENSYSQSDYQFNVKKNKKTGRRY